MLIPDTISDKDFKEFKKIIYDNIGIKISDAKKSLIIARLTRRLKELNINSFTEYLNYIKNQGHNSEEMINFINRITTNKTDFFREKHHFEFLEKEHLPKIIANNNPYTILVWSAGCSSGEEPYTIAMVLDNFLSKHSGWDFKILATDIDTEILTKASQGIYREQLLYPVPQSFKQKYFEKIELNGQVHYKVKPLLRGKISFRKLNFKLEDYRIKVKFDFIFFRNVMIYFDNDLKRHVLNKFYQYLKDDGLIFIGHSESLLNFKNFKYIKSTIYTKV